MPGESFMIKDVELIKCPVDYNDWEKHLWCQGFFRKPEIALTILFTKRYENSCTKAPGRLN